MAKAWQAKEAANKERQNKLDSLGGRLQGLYRANHGYPGRPKPVRRLLRFWVSRCPGCQGVLVKESVAQRLLEGMVIFRHYSCDHCGYDIVTETILSN